jgi:hypothetical protein
MTFRTPLNAVCQAKIILVRCSPDDALYKLRYALLVAANFYGNIVAGFREQSSLLRVGLSQAFASRARSYGQDCRKLSRAELAPTGNIVADAVEVGARAVKFV